MKQENANQPVQAYTTAQKYKQNTGLQGPCLCPINPPVFLKNKSYVALQQGFEVLILTSISTDFF